MFKTQVAVRQARVDALRDALDAMAGSSDALSVLERLLVEAQEQVDTGMYPIGASIGYVGYSGIIVGVIVAYTDKDSSSGLGYIVDTGEGIQTWINAKSDFVVPFRGEDS